jgi:hypothetical protein
LPEVPENALVAFGVLEDKIDHEQYLRGRVLAKALFDEKPSPQASLCDDIEDMKDALKNHPEVFRYLRSTMQTKETEKPENQPPPKT